MENYNRIVKDEYETRYYLNDKLHRLDGPAKEYIVGTKVWYQNNNIHRIDGPAIEYSDGTKCWYQNGLQHRIDGPACEWINGKKSWYYEGKYINCTSQEEFERLIKLKLFW
jgi:hypothetical protein